MINISKLFAVWATALKQDKFRLATLKLTFFYVLSTAVILFVSSVAILIFFAPPETELPFQREVAETENEQEHGEWDLYELREHLPAVVALVDLSILFVVSILSYYFAGRTLLPLKTMHEEQQRFMSDVAHELRTPLSVMLAGADTLLRKQRQAPEYEAFITDVQQETTRLTRLSNQLLQLLRTGQVKGTSFLDVNLSLLATAEVNRFISYAENCGVVLAQAISPDVTVSTDADSFIEILQNLLKNAVDYNHEGGSVTVSLFEKDTTVVLEITDTGIGMSPAEQTAVFNRFVKGDTARTQTAGSGSGLGLSIVKSLVTKLGGQITLASILGVGTTITVTLPKTHS